MILSLLVFAQLVGPGSAERIGVNFPPPPDDNILETYPAVEGHTSSLYTVTVSQGTPENSPVLFGENQSGITSNSDANHWTQYSFAGDPVEVVVTLLTGDVTTATIRPLNAGITPTVDTEADTVTFTMTEPDQLWVDIGDYKDPLFVFASPIDDDVPEAGDNVIIFEAGIHNLDPTYTPPNGTVDKYDVPFGTHIYVHGGAWVEGSILVGGGSGAFRLRGRGTVSGGIYEYVQGNENRKILETPSSGTGTVEVEGVTFTDPSTHIFVSFDPGIVTRDVKFFGFHRTSDGLRLNANSLIEDSFFKVNDDLVKLYGSNITATNITAWMQHTGSAFQLSWNLSASVSGGLVSGVDIIHNDRPLSGLPGNYTQTINNSVIGSRNLNGASISGIVFENFRIETQPYQLFGLWLKWDTLATGLGSISGLTFRDWEVVGGSLTSDYFNPNGATSPGTITDLVFDNVQIDDVALTDTSSFVCATGADCGSFIFQ